MDSRITRFLGRVQDLAIASAYWLVIVPGAFVLRLMGRGRFPGPDPQARTYWQSRRR